MEKKHNEVPFSPKVLFSGDWRMFSCDLQFNSIFQRITVPLFSKYIKVADYPEVKKWTSYYFVQDFIIYVTFPNPI